MAQTTKDLRDLLDKIKGDPQRALALLPSEAELRSLGWKCTACGHVKHFTRPITAAVAERCPKCKGDSFRAYEYPTLPTPYRGVRLAARTSFVASS
jgi:predicted Zn-ribbon and HTH transcriptional regulator